MLEQFTQIGDEARAELANVTDAESLEAFRIKYLGRKGSVTGMLSMIGKLPKEQKREGGQLANKIKQEITEAFEVLKADLGASTKKTEPMIDVTLPGIPVAQGKSHIISQTISELLEIFGRMGFDIAYGPEVEDVRLQELEDPHYHLGLPRGPLAGNLILLKCLLVLALPHI